MTKNEAIKAANLLLDGALSFMAKKAGVSVAEIAATLKADPQGATARYFAGLIAIGIENVDRIVAC